MKRCPVCDQMVKEGCGHSCLGVPVEYYEIEFSGTPDKGMGTMSLARAMGLGHPHDFIGGDDD